MEEKIEYEGEAPSMTEGDWRWQETVNMAPGSIMEELLGLSEEILDFKTVWEEARFESRQVQEQLKLLEAQVLQAALDSSEPDVVAQVSAKNAETRRRKGEIYVAAHSTIIGLAAEALSLERLEIATRLAMEALVDRQKNLTTWARMFEATTRLLATVRMPEKLEVVIPESILTEHDVESLVRVSEDEVLDAMAAGGIELAVDHDEGEYGSMEVAPDEVEALKAAVERQLGEVADGSLGPSL